MVRFRANLYGTKEEEADYDIPMEGEEQQPQRRIFGHVVQTLRQATTHNLYQSIHPNKEEQENENFRDVDDAEEDDDGDGDNNAITSWNEQMQQHPASSYHIYYHHPIPPQKRQWISWPLVVGISTILIQLVIRYGPPAPPPSDASSHHQQLTWSDFISKEVHQLLSSAISLGAAALYSLHWCFEGIKQDSHELFNAMQQKWKEQYQHQHQEQQSHQCPLRIPKPYGTLEQVLQVKIVGQEHAITSIADALDSWEENTVDNDNDVQNQRRPPLLMIFSGTVGVGKLETTIQTTRLLFQHCWNSSTTKDRTIENESNSNINQNSNFLFLHGADYNVVNLGSNNQLDNNKLDFVSNKLYRKIGEHVRKRNNQGVVVIIHRIEEMDASIFIQLCRDLNNPIDGSSATLSYYSTAENTDDGWVQQQQQRQQHWQQEDSGSVSDSNTSNLLIEVECNGVIFMFTTNIGAKNIAANIKQFGSIMKHGLDLSLRHAFNEHFSNNGVGSLFHTIAPFKPLGPSDLKKILIKQIQELSSQRSNLHWKSLVVTDVAASTMVDDEHVEYIRWGRKRVDESDMSSNILVFPTNGGKVLGSTMNTVKSRLNRCISKYRPEQVVVIDYDTNMHEVYIMWCLDENNVSSSRCEEICRFRL